MKEMTLNANAKINISLDVLSSRDDGYHELEMVMCEIPLFDVVKLKKQKDITLHLKGEFTPNNTQNTAYKAAKAFFDYTKSDGGVEIYIEKNIPVCAGLAGGSTDAAAVIKGLDRLYETKLTLEEMIEIGDTVGKDVPFCLHGGTCLAKGTGEKLEELSPLKNCYIVLIKPDNIYVSTKDVFEKYDNEKNELHPYTKGIVKKLEEKNPSALSRMMYNVLENVTSKMHSEISELKNELLDMKAEGAVMSGSGPSVFGIFTNFDNAKKALSHFKEKYNHSYLLDMYKNK